MRPDHRPLGLGRRGAALLVFAFIWCWIITNNVIVHEPVVNEALFHTGWPTWFRAAEWYTAAALAVVFAWRDHDWAGYAALAIPPLLRAGSLITGQVVYWLPDGNPGYPTGIWDSLLYLGIVAILAVCAGWPDYPPRLKQAVEEAKEGDV